MTAEPAVPAQVPHQRSLVLRGRQAASAGVDPAEATEAKRLADLAAARQRVAQRKAQKRAEQLAEETAAVARKREEDAEMLELLLWSGRPKCNHQLIQALGAQHAAQCETDISGGVGPTPTTKARSAVKAAGSPGGTREHSNQLR